tara:strand:- start:386 stop:1489 length:1104 start_codon:yes stop_codon:yes gene_type:complete
MTNKLSSNQISLFCLIFLLLSIGLVVMYSASSLFAMNNYDNYMFFLLQQGKWCVIGISIMLFISKIDYHIYKKLAYSILIGSWLILILGYFFKGENPASRWLYIGGRSWMTTSDCARIGIIIFTSYFIDRHYSKINNWKFIFINYSPYLIITLILILFQPDTSTSITIALIILIMLFIAGADFRFFALTSVIGSLILFLKIINTPYALSRIVNWNDLQKIHSLNAFGSGGIFGVGLGDSIIKNGYLPQSHTDFILPIIGEELGFLGIILIFSLFWALFRKGLLIARSTKDRFGIFLSLGIIISIKIYFIINSAYVIGLAPTTGLPMPFISYGGSHIIFTLLSMGILLNISQTKYLRYRNYGAVNHDL